jgi:hypothetical protein
MNLYRQTIVIFGIVVPIFIAAAAVGGCFILKSKVVASYENKLKSYKAYEISRLSSLEIETKVNKDRENLARWNDQLSQETASAVTTNLREISELLPTKEIQQTAFERPNGSGGLGNTTAQPSSQIRIAFRGTFRTMQRAFLELETRMPRLQLQDLKIDPSSSGSMLLNFQVTYNAWEN